MTRLLLIDDEAVLTMLLSEALQEEGYEVVTAPDGEAGLMLMLRERPDLVILDLVMPLMGGRLVLEAMRVDSRLRDVPVILLTGAPGWGGEFPPSGYQAFLAKPFAVRDLLRTIRTLLRRQSQAS